MAFSLHITAKALAEIDGALAWRAQQSISAAARWYDKLMKTVNSLTENPAQWPLAPESEWYPGIRQRIFGKRRAIYRVLFEIRDHTVYILRVRHGAQDLLKPGDLDT